MDEEDVCTRPTVSTLERFDPAVSVKAGSSGSIQLQLSLRLQVQLQLRHRPDRIARPHFARAAPIAVRDTPEPFVTRLPAHE